MDLNLKSRPVVIAGSIFIFILLWACLEYSSDHYISRSKLEFLTNRGFDLDYIGGSPTVMRRSVDELQRRFPIFSGFLGEQPNRLTLWEVSAPPVSVGDIQLDYSLIKHIRIQSYTYLRQLAELEPGKQFESVNTVEFFDIGVPKSDAIETKFPFGERFSNATELSIRNSEVELFGEVPEQLLQVEVVESDSGLDFLAEVAEDNVILDTLSLDNHFIPEELVEFLFMNRVAYEITISAANISERRIKNIATSCGFRVEFQGRAIQYVYSTSDVE